MKHQITQTIRQFINSRPGFDPRNYSDARSYRADQRTATKDRAAALALLAVVENRDTITAAVMLDRRHTTGRFTVTQDADTIRANYTAGQYYPTEYRAGAARYLAVLIWDYLRDHATPPNATGADIRRAAALMLGASLARRFFN